METKRKMEEHQQQMSLQVQQQMSELKKAEEKATRDECETKRQMDALQQQMRPQLQQLGR